MPAVNLETPRQQLIQMAQRSKPRLQSKVDLALDLEVSDLPGSKSSSSTIPQRCSSRCFCKNVIRLQRIQNALWILKFIKARTRCYTDFSSRIASHRLQTLAKLAFYWHHQLLSQLISHAVHSFKLASFARIVSSCCSDIKK